MPLSAVSAQPVFRALADPTRCAIVQLLAGRDLSLGEIAGRFDMTRPAVAKHLGVLKAAGLVSVTAAGRERIHHLQPDALKRASDWLKAFDQFWDDRLAALKTAVETDQ